MLLSALHIVFSSALSLPIELNFPCDLSTAEQMCVGTSTLVPWQTGKLVTLRWATEVGDAAAALAVDVSLLRSTSVPAAQCDVSRPSQAVVMRGYVCTAHPCELEYTVPPALLHGWYTLRVNGTNANGTIAACSRPFAVVAPAAVIPGLSPAEVVLDGPTSPFTVEPMWSAKGLESLNIELVVQPDEVDHEKFPEQRITLAKDLNASAGALSWSRASPSASFDSLSKWTTIGDIFSADSFFNFTNGKCVRVATTGEPACADRTQVFIGDAGDGGVKSERFPVVLKSNVFNVSAVDWEVGQEVTLNTNVWNVSEIETKLIAKVFNAEGNVEQQTFLLRGKKAIKSDEATAHFRFRLPNITLAGHVDSGGGGAALSLKSSRNGGLPYARVNITSEGFTKSSDGTSKLVWRGSTQTVLSAPAIGGTAAGTAIVKGCPFETYWSLYSYQWGQDGVELTLLGNESATKGHVFVAGTGNAKDGFMVSYVVNSSSAFPAGKYVLRVADSTRASAVHNTVEDPHRGQTYEYFSQPVIVHAKTGAHAVCPQTRPTPSPTQAGGAAAAAAKERAIVAAVTSSLVGVALLLTVAGGVAIAVVLMRRKKAAAAAAEAPPLLGGSNVRRSVGSNATSALAPDVLGSSGGGGGLFRTGPNTLKPNNGNRNRNVSSYDKERMW